MLNMAASRQDIERALDDMISNEEGMRFQGLAVVCGKLNWPGLIACERHNDLGLDAYLPTSLAPGGRGMGLACSVTASLSKIREDARKIKRNFSDVNVLVFATPVSITNYSIKKNDRVQVLSRRRTSQILTGFCAINQLQRLVRIPRLSSRKQQHQYCIVIFAWAA